MKKNKIFIACDTKNISKVKKIFKYSSSKKIIVGYKFGLEFFAPGPGLIITIQVFQSASIYRPNPDLTDYDSFHSPD